MATERPPCHLVQIRLGSWPMSDLSEDARVADRASDDDRLSIPNTVTVRVPYEWISAGGKEFFAVDEAIAI
jgi:hypothetical protein